MRARPGPSAKLYVGCNSSTLPASKAPIANSEEDANQNQTTMAVPGRGLVEADDNDEENALFEEEGLEDLDSQAPPHLRAISDATQLGDVDALRLALGTYRF